MNKHCYRLIFSRTHGELRVVSELARSYSTEPGQSRGSGGIRLWVTVRRAVWLLGLALFAGPVLADGIVADVTAAPGQRPEVIATQNGLPQVNITAPNQAGISHNQYQQFDVDAKGAILNNSAVITATQMAGMIQSNPNLNPNAAPARVILNEVNSNDPSQLRGFLEVAGGQAQVIVANPAGIVCNGCGTLNAGRMTLTTGKPQLNADGSLAGYQVERGVVRVEGGGLNGDTRHDTEYVDILARAVDINAGVWAKAGLSVVAGRNRIGADGTTATPLADDGSTKPELAIDMGQMGGMYSGQIRMIGTEAGVGVRNQGGHLQAGKTLTISSEGKLSWQSAAQEAVTVAGGDIRLTARNAIDHHGKLHSGGTLVIASRAGKLRQSGTLAATGDVRLSANSGIESHGHLLAGSNANSQIVCDADLRLDSQGDIRASGSLLGKKDVTLVGHRVDISGVQLAANHATLVAREDGVALRQSQVDSGQFTLNTVGDVDAQQAQVKAGRWEVNTHHLHNQKAVWTQTGGGESHFTLTGKLDNTDGSIEAHSLALTSGALTNQHGRLVALNDSAQYWRVSGILDNNSGELGSNGDLQLDTGRLDNQGGTVKTQAALTLYASGDINNTQGKVLAGNALRLDALGAFDNQHGQVNGAQLLLTAQRLNNAQGQVASQGDVTLTTRQGLNNQRGLIGAGKALTIHIGDDGDNGAGSAQSETPLMATAQNIDNGATRSRSGQALTSNAAGAIDNRAGEISGESLVLTAQQINNTQGKVIAQRDANLTAQQALSNANGLLEAGGTLSMRTDGDWDNRDGTAQGGHQVTVATHTLNNASGRLQSGGDLTLDSTGDISNQRGKLTAQHTLDIKGATTGLFDNDGGSLQSGGPLSLHGGRLTNRQSGRVLSQQALSLILADDWDNQDGQLTSSGRTLVRAAGLHNAQGAINALGNLDMQFTGKLDNAHGHLFSQSTQTLQAQEIDNQLGWMGSQGDWFATSEHFDNTGGSVQGQQGVQLAATWLHNAKGVLQSAARLALRVAQDIDNQKGKIAAQGPLAVQGTTPDATTGRINNAGGKWLAGEALNIAAISLNNTQGGLLYSQKHLYLNLKEQLDNRQGRLQGGEALKLDAQTLNNASGTIDGQQRLALRILGGLDNAGGAVRSNGDQQITAASIDNRQGVFSSRGGLTLTAARLDNTNGTLISQGTGIYRIEMLDNRQGKVHSGEALTLDGRQVNNQRGQLVSSQALTLKANQLDNSGQGTLSSQAALEVQTDHLDNRDGGRVLGTTHTSVTARDIDNMAGWLQSAGTLSLTGVSTLNNRQGRILTNDALSINAGQAPTDSPLVLLNQNGRLESADALTLHTRTLDNQGGTLLGLQALTLTAQQDYTHQAGETISSNGTVTFSVSGAFNNLSDWLLPGNLILNAARITNPATLVGKKVQLTTHALQNTGRLEANNITLNVDTLDNAATLMGDDISVQGRVIDQHGQAAVMAATQTLTLQAGERLTNRDGALLYSSGRLHLGSNDLIENRASFIEAEGDVRVEAQRLNNLREGLVIERDAEKSDYKWHRYNYYWRSYGMDTNTDKRPMAPTTQRLTFRDDASAQNNRYGTLLAIDAAGKRAQVRVKDNRDQLTDLWVNYLALKPNADGSYAMTFYETRGFQQVEGVPTPYHNTVWREFDSGRIEQWDPEQHLDIDKAPGVTDYNNLRERSATGTVTRDRLVSEGVGAHILAGGNMVLHITGALLNDASVITANHNLGIEGNGKVDNRGYSVNERRHEYIVDHYDQDTHHWHPTFQHDETTALTTVDGVITGNGNVSIHSAHITNTTVNQAQTRSLEAALKAVDAERAEVERNPLAFTVDGGTPPTPGSQTALSPSSPLERPLLPAQLALTAMQHLGNVATAIPNNGLFRQHPAIGSPFLVVTDERFTRRDAFISSDYLLSRVGYHPAQVHKRLGDGFYEQRLVREQVQHLIGRPSVHGEDAMTQYQHLMNNGAKVAQDFHLLPGVALTPKQIAALQQDIVWLVSETVNTAEGPQTVWVPKVYLAQRTLRLTGDGAIIGGNNLQLSAGSVSNAGNLFANKVLTVDTGQFAHQGGDIRAGSINVRADSLTLSTNLQDALRQATMSAGDISLSGSDIHLRGAKLNATQNLSLNARNNLHITAAKNSHTANLEVISGSMGNRTRDGMEEAGTRMAQISGKWQQAQSSELNAGGNLSLKAGQDITVQGSQVRAGGTSQLQAAGNITLRAETTTNNTHLTANSRTSSVNNHRQEDSLLLSSLSGDKGVTLVAGNHLLAEGAQVDSAEGRIGLSAQDVTIKDARQHIADQDNEQKHSGKTQSQRARATERENSIGSTFSSQQGVTAIARQGDVTVTGSTLHSEQGAITLQAKKDVTLNSATERESQYSEERSERKRFLSKSSSHTLTDDRVTYQKGTLLSGEHVSISAGHDLRVKGSSIAADRDVSLQAGHNVDIGAATETASHTLLEEEKKSGLLSSGGIGFTIGSQSSKHEIDEKDITQSQSVSTIGSNQGNVSITAGHQMHIGGADLVAGKDLNLTGDSVTIDPGYDQRTRTETFEQKQSGLSVALSGTVGSALNTAVSAAQQARKEGDSRLGALQNTKAALSGVQAAQAWERDNALTASAEAKNAAAGLQPGDKGAAQGATNTVGISASYGSQSSKSETRTDSRQSQGSTLTARQNMSITATGKNNTAHSGDITIAGSRLKAGKELQLDAARDITLQSAQNSESTIGKNSSKGGNVGVGIGVGSGGYGISVSAGINAGKGHENGNGLTHTETTLDAGSNLSLTSGRDTTLKGAQASGGKITVDVGRNLTLQSEQASNSYDAKQQNVSAGGSFTFGSTTGSANVSVSQDKLKSNFDSVKEQTGLFAGKGGYDVKVKDHTQLDGAVIASTANKDKNHLNTGTLSWTDIHNQADYQAEHSGGSLSTGGPVGKDLLTNMAGGMLSGANNSGHAEGTTQAGVSEGTLIVRDTDKQQQDIAQLNRDTTHANDGSITPIFDKEQEQSRLKQAQLIGEIAGQAMDVIRTQGDIAGLKAQKEPGALAQARKQLEKSGKSFSDAEVMQRAYDNAMQQYGTGSGLQKAAQAVTGVLTALAGNNLAGALANAASPYLATEIKKLTTNPLTGKVDVTANAMAHAVLGAVTAQLNNQSAAAGGLGAGGGELAARYIAEQLFPGKKPDALNEAQKQQVSALSQLAAGLAGGLATGDTGGAVTAAQTGKNAVENNSLSGDKARETVKQAAESLKDQIRNKLGEGTTSSIANAIINGLADTGDAALGSVDYAADAAMALAACAAGDSYCSTALNDLAGKNQAVADSVKALMQSETWSTVADTIKQASEGNQGALEATGGMLAGIILPGKKVPVVIKAVDPTIKIATGSTVGAFEASLSKLPPGERVAIVKETVNKVVVEQGMVKDNKLTKLNNRDVYRGTDGNLYALDTQHGRFEAVSPKGKHLGEVDFSMQKIPNSIDKSGGHDLKVK